MSEPAAVALCSCLDNPARRCVAPMQLFRFTLVLGTLLFLSDLVVAFMAIVLPDVIPREFDIYALVQRCFGSGVDWVVSKEMITGVFIVGCLLAWFHRLRHYQVRLPFRHEARQVIFVATIVLAVHDVLRWVLFSMTPDRFTFVSWGVAVVLLLAGRYTWRTFLRRHDLGRVPIVLVGSGSMVETTASLLQDHLDLDYEIVGGVDPHVLFSLAEREYRHDFHRRGGAASAIVVLDENPAAAALTERLLRQGLLTGVVVSQSLHGNSLLRPIWRGLFHDASSFRQVFSLSADLLMLVPRSRISDPVSRVLKRSLDVFGAAVAILLAATVFAPFFLWLAWVVKADGGPLFFSQRRVGYQGRLFNCLKFRTMTVDAEQVLRHELLRDPEKAKEWGEDVKLRRDPRVTPIGRFLRRTSIDELPQIINVLRGEMSLVGARPIVPAELERYGEDAAYYLRSRPGLTGLWQVSGRNNLDYPTRVHLDASYVRNWTFGYDIAILLRTFPALLSGQGAY